MRDVSIKMSTICPTTSTVFRFSAALSSAFGSLPPVTKSMTKNRGAAVALLHRGKKRNHNKTSFYRMFYSRNTQRTPWQKKNKKCWFLCCFWSNQTLQYKHGWSMCFCSFRKNTILDSLLLFVKPLQLGSLLILSFYSIFLHFTKFCPVLQARFLPPLSPLKPRPFVDACITAWTSLRAMLFKAILLFGFDLLWLRECVWWCCFYLHALVHERFVPRGLCSSQLQ